MRNWTSKAATILAVCTLLGLTIPGPGFAEQTSDKLADRPQVELVIALDVSGSMEGLIASAKQRLWDIVNELGRAQPQPRLRISIVSYGNPEYGVENGYVRIDQPFTGDLDAVNRTLFSFGTNGGDEYVARAITTSINQLAWSDDNDVLKILFVAGNEAATQDPQVSVHTATQMANARGIVVNTIYCGTADDNLAAGWQELAMMTNGLYAAIDQESAAVANIATPVDEELLALNVALNETYVAYGDFAEESRENMVDQDANAGSMSQASAASRAVTKASKLYENSSWDLVDAVVSGTSLDDIEVASLPAELQAMDKEEREAFVAEQAGRRDALQAEIQDLGRQRRDYIENERKKMAADAPAGLDEVIQDGVRSLAKEKGFRFEE